MEKKEIPGKPLVLIEADDDGNLKINEKAVEKIRNINGPIAVVLIVVLYIELILVHS